MRGQPASHRPVDHELAPLIPYARRYFLLVWRIRFGWLLVTATGIGLAAASIGLLASPAGQALDQVAFDLLLGAWLCLGVLVAMWRRQMRGPAAQWPQLTAAGKFGRLLVTVLGTALLAAPFAWLGWTVFR